MGSSTNKRSNDMAHKRGTISTANNNNNNTPEIPHKPKHLQPTSSPNNNNNNTTSKKPTIIHHRQQPANIVTNPVSRLRHGRLGDEQPTQQPMLRKSTSSRFGKNLLPTWLGGASQQSNNNNSNNAVAITNMQRSTSTSSNISNTDQLDTTFEKLLACIFFHSFSERVSTYPVI